MKKKEDKEQVFEKERLPDKLISNKAAFDLALLGEIDNMPFNIEDIKKNHSIKWGNFQEVIDIFKDVKLENYIEQHTELYTD